MKKYKKMLLGSILLTSLLSSCSLFSNEIEEIKKDVALKELNNNEAEVTCKTYNNNYFVNDDYVIDSYGNRAVSIHSGKQIPYIAPFDKRYVHGLSYYFDGYQNCYDAFGTRIEVPNFSDYLRAESYKFVLNKKSPLYTHLTGINYKTNELTYIYAIVCEYDYDAYIILTGINDTHFKAENIFKRSENQYLVDSLFKTNVRFDQINSTEWRFTDYWEENKQGRIVAIDSSNSPTDTSIQVDNYYEDENSNDSEFYTLIDFTLKESSRFQWMVKPIDEISNDFDFVENGRKYQARILTANNEIKKCKYVFMPTSLRIAFNETKAVLLAKEILNDGNLSNKNYVITIDQKHKFSKPYSDVSIYEKNSSAFLFKNKLIELEDEKTLYVLTDEYYIYKDKGRYFFVNVEETYGNNAVYNLGTDTLNTTRINGCYVATNENQITTYRIENGFIMSAQSHYKFKLLDYKYGIFESENKIYAGDTILTSLENYKGMNSVFNRVFGEESNVILIDNYSNLKAIRVKQVK